LYVCNNEEKLLFIFKLMCNTVKIVRIILENVGILRPKRDLEDFTLFDIDPKGRKCPSARCPSAADASGNYIGI